MVRTPLKQGEIIQLNNRQYTIDKVIGDGATCIVYSAYYSDSSGHPHHVNIKECYPHNVDIARQEQKLCWNAAEDKSKSITAFRNAYDKVMLCQNANFTVHAFDIFENNNTAYIIMDANDGVTFDKDSADNIADILKTVKLLAHVVGEYHKNGYLHLDIKPSNFLVYPRPSEHIVLFDMDTVTSLENIRLGNISGCSYSDGWAAPEQKQGKINKLCPATDIFAIGAILFEKIMGRQVESSDLGVFADWEFDGEKFEDINPKIKRLLRNIFRKSLSANIKRRYQAADELITDLQKAIKTTENNVYLLSDNISCTSNFVGRESELSQINEAFADGNRMVFLYGLGGIGKTEIAKKYVQRHSKEYDAVLFVKYDSNFTLQDLLDDVQIENFDGDIKEHRRKFRTLLTENVLVIVDNFDIELGEDNGLEELLKTKAQILVSTRTDFSEVYSEKTKQIHIEKLSSNELEQIFINNAHVSMLAAEEKVLLNKLIQLVEYHTYATELLARQMYYSGLDLSTLYEKIKSGLSSLTNDGKIVTNKDNHIVKDNSLNILRAVFHISDLSEGQKQVLRNMSLLHFVKVTKDAYKELLKYDPANFISATPRDKAKTQLNFIDDFNTLVEIGLIKKEQGFFGLHKLIYELVNIELKPNENNCANIYFYVLSLIEWFSDEDEYEPSPIKQAEAENKGRFLLLFFEKIDLNNKINLNLVLRWLRTLFKSSFSFMDSTYVDKKFTQLYYRLETISNINNDLDKYELFSTLFFAWLYICNFFFVTEKEEEGYNLEVCENKIIKFYELSLLYAKQLDGISTGTHTEKIIEHIAGELEACASQILFAEDIYGTDVTYKKTNILGPKIPKTVVQKSYKLMPEVFCLSARSKRYFDLPLTKEDLLQLEISPLEDTLLGKTDKSVDKWMSLCEAIINDFNTSENKDELLNTLPENKKYTPSQKVYLLEELLDKAFDKIMWPQSKKNRASSEKHLKETNWAFIGEILNLQCIIAASAEEANYVWCDADLEYLAYIPKYRTILSAILDSQDEFSKWIQIIFEEESPFMRLYSLDGYSFNVSVSEIITACEIMHKCRYVLPYITRELMNWLSDLEDADHGDSIDDYFMAIETIAECANQALGEIDDTDESFEMFKKIRDWATDLLDSITNKTFDLKDDTEE